jgi:hypothetical protein
MVTLLWGIKNGQPQVIRWRVMMLGTWQQRTIEISLIFSSGQWCGNMGYIGDIHYMIRSVRQLHSDNASLTRQRDLGRRLGRIANRKKKVEKFGTVLYRCFMMLYGVSESHFFPSFAVWASFPR